MTHADESIDAKFLSQWEAVYSAALHAGIALERSAATESHGRHTPLYVYEQDRVLVRAADRDELTGRLDATLVPNRGAGQGEVLLFEIGERAPDAARRVNGELDRRVVTPNHLVSVCPVQMCPADEPVPLPVTGSQQPWPPRKTGNGGQGVQVDVLDTGMTPGFEHGHAWLAGITQFQECSSFAPTGAIKEYAGHGMFVTGVLRCAAPATSVLSQNIFSFAGAAMEDQLGNALLASLNGRPDIISLSAGGTTMGATLHMALEPFMAKLTEPGCPTLLVAAAGNDGRSDGFFPAAYSLDAGDAVLSVGALRYDDGGRACFSNYGEWVDVYAPGERHVNAFPSGAYSYVDPQVADLSCRFYRPDRLYAACTCVTMPPQGAFVAFRGMARWSGTSFATPLVAGRIATYMSAHPGVDARTAAKHLLAATEKLTDADGELLAVLSD